MYLCTAKIFFFDSSSLQCSCPYLCLQSLFNCSLAADRFHVAMSPRYVLWSVISAVSSSSNNSVCLSFRSSAANIFHFSVAHNVPACSVHLSTSASSGFMVYALSDCNLTWPASMVILHPPYSVFLASAVLFTVVCRVSSAVAWKSV